MIRMLRLTFLFLSLKKIPFVLCGSRFAPLMMRADETVFEGNERWEFPTTSSPPSTNDGVVSTAISAVQSKIQKKRAFGALVRWCVLHQRVATHKMLMGDISPGMATPVCSLPPLKSDETVLGWLQESSSALTCGQALLVCSFVCEVFLCRLDIALKQPKAEEEALFRDQVQVLTNRIAALLQRASASDKLECQPLSILMSCVYGLHRLLCLESPFLGENEKALLKIPTALMFAILHQLRGEALGKLFRMEAHLAVGVCLSFLLIVNEDRRQAFFSEGDTVLVSTVLRRLVRHIGPLLRPSDRLCEDDLERLAGDSFPSGPSPLLCGLHEGSVDSPSMQECVVIMQNIAFSSATYRLGVLSYLLRVRRRPAQYTREEVQLLPAVLQTVANIRTSEAHAIIARIVEEIPLLEDDPVLMARLFRYAGSKQAQYLTCLNSTRVGSLSSQDAREVIHCVGVYLQWETLQRLVELVLGDTSSVLFSPSLSSSKIVLSDATETVLAALLARLANPSPCAEKYTMQVYVAQLVSSIDWAAGPPAGSAKLALRRLSLLKKLLGGGFRVDAPDVVTALVEKALDLESGSSMITTLKHVMEALSLLSDAERCRGVVERMIVYNGTRSTSSLIRFLAFLAPLAIKYGVQNGELVQQLLKMQTLSPFKLRHGLINGVSKDVNIFTLFLIHAINFLLASEEWRTSADQFREVVTLWIEDYLHYVMNLSRKRNAVNTSTREEAKGEATSLQDADPEATETEGPSHEQLEEVFVCMLRANVKMPNFFASELTSRVRNIEHEGMQTDGTGCKARFLLPGHFVFCCKLDVPTDSLLSVEFLEYLITTCDCRVLYFVITAFLMNAKATAQETSASLLTNLRLVCQCLQLFLGRIDPSNTDLTTAFYPSSVSSVVMNVIRFVVGFLTKQERNQRVLERLRNLTSGDKEEGVEKSHEELLVELTTVEALLLRVMSYLSAAHRKDLGLLLLDRLELLAPASADYLMLHLKNQIADFSQVELFYLVRKYPKAQDLVIRELQKCDIAASVDLNDYVRVARNIPTTIHIMVIEAHLPTLSFQWCTRLLSTLAVRHELIPMRLLKPMLQKLEEEVGNATVMDRNVALVVIQKYLSFEQPLVEEELLCERRPLVERCRKCLLSLDDIHSLDSLSGFLSAFPNALHDVIGETIADHTARVVVPGLLTDLDGILTLCGLLQKHKLLYHSVRLAVAEGFFMGTLRVENNVHASSSSSSVTYPLGNVLALALLLSDGLSQTGVPCRDEALTPDEDNTHNSQPRHHQNTIANCIFQIVRARYSSLPSRLVITSTLVEQKDTAGGGGQSHLAIAEEICAELIEECEKMTSSEFSRLLQCISRLKCWHLVKDGGTHFSEAFQRACKQADAHSRCVAFKALSSDVELFRYYEPLMMPLLGEAVDVMSQENLEMILSSVLGLPFTEALESLIDAIGSRMLSMADQCRRSALIRMLQCHAVFGLRDDVLVTRLFAILEEQCDRETRLDTTQVLTLLQSAVDLDVPIPSRLAVTCFSWLEYHIDGMTTAQLGHALRLATGVEMGYTASVHAVAMRALEQREAIRSNAAFRKSVELFCDEFSVEVPWNMRVIVQRRRHQVERLKEYNARGVTKVAQVSD